jgi:hypothetical protein
MLRPLVLITRLFCYWRSNYIYGGSWANFEFDLKKIIVLSVLSQLGITIMIISIGLSGLVFSTYWLMRCYFDSYFYIEDVKFVSNNFVLEKNIILF